MTVYFAIHSRTMSHKIGVLVIVFYSGNLWFCLWDCMRSTKDFLLANCYWIAWIRTHKWAQLIGGYIKTLEGHPALKNVLNKRLTQNKHTILL